MGKNGVDSGYRAHPCRIPGRVAGHDNRYAQGNQESASPFIVLRMLVTAADCASMAATVEMQNTGDAAVRSEVGSQANDPGR